MTLPDERRRAIMQVKDFLMRLSSPRVTPDVEKAIREEAARLLKHYPVNQNELNKLGD
jgi:predicted metal-dependent hydrolase